MCIRPTNSRPDAFCTAAGAADTVFRNGSASPSCGCLAGRARTAFGRRYVAECPGDKLVGAGALPKCRKAVSRRTGFPSADAEPASSPLAGTSIWIRMPPAAGGAGALRTAGVGWRSAVFIARIPGNCRRYGSAPVHFRRKTDGLSGGRPGTGLFRRCSGGSCPARCRRRLWLSGAGEGALPPTGRNASDLRTSQPRYSPGTGTEDDAEQESETSDSFLCPFPSGVSVAWRAYRNGGKFARFLNRCRTGRHRTSGEEYFGKRQNSRYAIRRLVQHTGCFIDN